MHGDADAVVPFQMSEIMRAKMSNAGADVRLIRLAGGETSGQHGWPDVFAEAVGWMDRHLKL